jgi:hypothetical protein
MKRNEWYIPDKMQHNESFGKLESFFCNNNKNKNYLIRLILEELTKVKYAGKLDGRRILCLWSVFVAFYAFPNSIKFSVI